MKRFVWPFLAAGALMLGACGSSAKSERFDAGSLSPETVDVTSDITTDTVWRTGSTYRLKKHVFVRSGTLTVEPGVTVLGDVGTSLVITTSARIHAAGTAQAPIVFTSVQPVGSRASGDWGGVVLLGRAPVNVAGGQTSVEGFPAGTDGAGYGGSDAAHDCGDLSYVRIEFAGFLLSQDNELNGLTLAGCGSETQVDHVQVHAGADDGIELFGGAPRLKHILVTQAEDDGLDWDLGFQGKVQFLIVQQNLLSNEAIEADNNRDNHDAAPRSNPELWNVTLVGSNLAAQSAGRGKAAQEQRALHLRRGTAGRLSNVIITGFADGSVDVDDPATVAQIPGSLFIQNSVFHKSNPATSAFPSPDEDDERSALIGNAALANTEENPKLHDAFNLTRPNFMLTAESPAATGPAHGATPPNDGFFDPSATHLGALGQTDWTAGWTAYPAS